MGDSKKGGGVMSEKTVIAWTSHTANFWMGCQKISPGCANCYAETLTKNRMGLSLWGPAKTTRRQEVKGICANLRKWNRASDPENPSKVFVGSLMDWAELLTNCYDDVVGGRGWKGRAATNGVLGSHQTSLVLRGTQ